MAIAFLLVALIAGGVAWYLMSRDDSEQRKRDAIRISVLEDENEQLEQRNEILDANIDNLKKDLEEVREELLKLRGYQDA